MKNFSLHIIEKFETRHIIVEIVIFHSIDHFCEPSKHLDFHVSQIKKT